jgi:hypothetical protein
MIDPMAKSTVNRMCAKYADIGVTLTVKLLPQDPKLVLVEGDELAFEFLGKLFLAHARGVGCGVQIGPRYAGNKLFSKKAKLGLYLHRLPCDNDTLKAHLAAPLKKKSGTQT